MMTLVKETKFVYVTSNIYELKILISGLELMLIEAKKELKKTKDMNREEFMKNKINYLEFKIKVLNEDCQTMKKQYWEKIGFSPKPIIEKEKKRKRKKRKK